MTLVKRYTNIWGDDVGRVEIRAGEDGKESRNVVGYGAVINSWSRDLGGFKERIVEGALDGTKKKDADIRALVGHKLEMIVGRTKSGTMKTSIDKKGLLTEVDVVRNYMGDALLESIRVGDVDGMSVGFRILDDHWRMEDDVLVRDVLSAEVIEVSYTAFPAYPETSAQVRDLSGIGIGEGERFLTAMLKREHGIELNAEDRKILIDAQEKIQRALGGDIKTKDETVNNQNLGGIRNSEWYRRAFRLADLHLSV